MSQRKHRFNAAGQRLCDAEDQGGWTCCKGVAVWIERDPTWPELGKAVYCADCRVNRHVWTEADAERELEPFVGDTP